ncbi:MULTISPECIES: hypothetical protein [unclassified Halanaerobium]|uniref:stalk domain-containing protein n=1 Tax=unclassified Halanaerobium TaxID=2641197 RepID=UPI000DF2B7AC|nr:MULTISPECIES: hypothetical protein [unclassified Halanaerobium]RCW41827.1 hypothetical protein DFR78_1294 [Halanaerobium sp. MA284_MarDTE_T2]RCW88019.1 hypothetical protein DER71_10551 [Halanaerobium sp. DL-01]
MKRYLFFIVVFFLVFYSLSLSAEEIDLNSFKFSIKPDNIEESTLIPASELKENLPLSFHRMEDNKFLIIFAGRFYLLNVETKNIKIEGGEIRLENNIFYLNGHLLLPVEFIKMLPGIDVDNSGKIIYDQNFAG